LISVVPNSAIFIPLKTERKNHYRAS